MIINKETITLFKKMERSAVLQYCELLQNILDSNSSLNLVRVYGGMGANVFTDKDGKDADMSDAGNSNRCYYYFTSIDDRGQYKQSKLRGSEKFLNFLMNLESKTGLNLWGYPCETINGKVVLDR